MSNSKGHKLCINGYEYFIAEDGSMYMANANNPLDVKGYRQGARFECAASLVNMRLGMLNKIAANGQAYF